MTDRILIPRVSADDKETSPAWWMADFDGKPFAVLTRCPDGHAATLRHLYSSMGHKIDDDGHVKPSIVCPHMGCRWHVFGRLEDWVPVAE